MKRYTVLTLICLLLTLSLYACASGRQQDPAPGEDGAFLIYYVSHDGNGIGAEPYEPVSDPADTRAMVEEVLAELGNNPLRQAYHAPLTGDIALREYRIDADGLLTLDFESRYLETDHVTEILDRAAIVRTLTQIEGVTGVLFLVSGTSLMTGRDEPVGVMDADTFIYNAGNEINTYDKTRITLYFADKTGEKLIPVLRNVVYHSNVSLERLVMEQLIPGPYTEDALATVNPALKILSVTLQDEICYVDVSEEILTPPAGIGAQAALYSVVNSLCEIRGVEQVHFYVNGDDQHTLPDGTSLASSFRKNSDIVVTQ